MTIGAEPELGGRRAQIKYRPLSAIQQFLQLFSRSTASVLQLRAGGRIVLLLIVTFSLAGASFAGVTITSPQNGSTVASPVHVVASATSSNPITFMRIYVDNIDVYDIAANRIDTSVSMAAGSHNIVVQAWDSKGTVFKAPITITVSAPPPPPGVTVSLPRNGATLASPIHVVASATSVNPITFMRIYLDNVSVYGAATNKIDTLVNTSTGGHNVIVQAWDSKGTVLKTPVSITVNPTTTLSAETSNNTSAADSFAAQSNGNAAAGNVSKVATRTLLYPGSTAKIYAHFLPWFGSPKHMSVGYISDDSQQIKKQVNDMVSRGLNGTIIDWYGIDPAGTDFLMIDHVTQLMMQEAELHPGFSFAIMYDQGALAPCANTPGCDMTQRMIDDLNHVNVSYWNSPAYQKSGSRPVLYFFLNPLYTIDWARLRTGVAGNPLFIFPHETGFTHAQSDGGFGWIKPEMATSSDPAALAYLDLYYDTATSTAKFSTGSGYPGFDDSLAPWGQHRKVAQQCGQTWLQTLDEAKNHYSTSSQMSGIQLVTWNDYEEGTEIETGIDNCVTVNASVAGTVVSWNVTGQATTLDHFSVFVSVAGGNLMWLKDTPVSTLSMDLAQFNLDPGSYMVYVKAFAKPSLTNKMSSGVQMTIPVH
jgi:hypothetical protein